MGWGLTWNFVGRVCSGYQSGFEAFVRDLVRFEVGLDRLKVGLLRVWSRSGLVRSGLRFCGSEIGLLGGGLGLVQEEDGWLSVNLGLVDVGSDIKM